MKHKMRFAAVLASMVGMSVTAATEARADTPCPTDYQIVGTNVAPNYTKVYLGNRNGQVTFFTRNDAGQCAVGPMYDVHYGIRGPASLISNQVLCLQASGRNIFFKVASYREAFDCNGVRYWIDPLNYGGRRLNTYLGIGNDTLIGGAGLDRLYGNGGMDSMSDPAGTASSSDRLYGESQDDLISCSNGQSSICDGNSGEDVVWTNTDNGDALYGGTEDDLITACHPTLVDCGESSGDDDSLFCGPNVFHTGCEYVNDDYCS